MTNEIKSVGNGSQPRLTQGAKLESADAAPTPRRGVSGTTSEKVSLTDTMARLQVLVHDLDDASIVDAGRVDALRDALSRGEYRIDDNRVAEKLLELERLLQAGGDSGDEQ